MKYIEEKKKKTGAMKHPNPVGVSECPFLFFCFYFLFFRTDERHLISGLLRERFQEKVEQVLSVIQSIFME